MHFIFAILIISYFTLNISFKENDSFIHIYMGLYNSINQMIGIIHHYEYQTLHTQYIHNTHTVQELNIKKKRQIKQNKERKKASKKNV